MILRACIFWFALATAAAAADLRVQVLDAGGRPVRDAVVTVHTQQRSAGPIRFVWPMRIAQRDMQFDPFVLIAPAGASVAFPNLDDVRHQVYSFSEAGPFELRLYGRDESRSVTFRNVGVISVGCNIHDRMSAFIYVVDTPFAAKTGADGNVTLSDIPQGAATVRVWHPYLRAPENRVDRQIVLRAENSAQRFDVRLRPPPDQAHGY
ncbi:MAG: methylamine utilization protein [Caulobacteraceae bacterium]